MNLNEKQGAEFEKLCEPLFAFLEQNHPNCCILVESDSAELLEGVYLTLKKSKKIEKMIEPSILPLKFPKFKLLFSATEDNLIHNLNEMAREHEELEIVYFNTEYKKCSALIKYYIQE